MGFCLTIVIKCNLPFTATESTHLQTKKSDLDALEKERKKWDSKVNQLETLREKNRKENASLIAKCEKRLEAARKKYDSKQKQFGDIDVEIKSKEALIADCQKVGFLVLFDIGFLC